MWRFLFHENIRRFRDRLVDDISTEQRETLQRLLAEAEAELDRFERAATRELARDRPDLVQFAE